MSPESNVGLSVKVWCPESVLCTATASPTAMDSDDGRGLDPADRGRRRRGSVGLDLLGRLVAGQGGRLSVDGPAEGGAQLVVRLPVPPVQTTVVAQEPTGVPR
jgi:hypothetical protein